METYEDMQSEKINSKLELISNWIKNEYSIEKIGKIISTTDFGVSGYLTFYKNEKLIKIRVSDHSASNSVRLENEIMFSVSDKIEKNLFTLKQILSPEKFSFRECSLNEKPTHIKNGKKCIIIEN
jgi:capsular polysaccharide biosynthesis protein